MKVRFLSVLVMLIKPVFFVSCNKCFKYKLYETYNEFSSVVNGLGRF